MQCCSVGVGESFRSGESFLLSKLFLGGGGGKVVFKEEWRRPAKTAGDLSVEICMQLFFCFSAVHFLLGLMTIEWLGNQPFCERFQIDSRYACLRKVSLFELSNSPQV